MPLLAKLGVLNAHALPRFLEHPNGSLDMCTLWYFPEPPARRMGGTNQATVGVWIRHSGNVGLRRLLVSRR
jgi:hypothetical protein